MVFYSNFRGFSLKYMRIPVQVSGATVQQQKKPSRAFSALLGNAVPKRKLDCSKKVNY